VNNFVLLKFKREAPHEESYRLSARATTLVIFTPRLAIYPHFQEDHGTLLRLV